MSPVVQSFAAHFARRLEDVFSRDVDWSVQALSFSQRSRLHSRNKQTSVNKALKINVLRSTPTYLLSGHV